MTIGPRRHRVSSSPRAPSRRTSDPPERPRRREAQRRVALFTGDKGTTGRDSARTSSPRADGLIDRSESMPRAAYISRTPRGARATMMLSPRLDRESRSSCREVVDRPTCDGRTHERDKGPASATAPAQPSAMPTRPPHPRRCLVSRRSRRSRIRPTEAWARRARDRAKFMPARSSETRSRHAASTRRNGRAELVERRRLRDTALFGS
jgi:hypothetical protein